MSQEVPYKKLESGLLLEHTRESHAEGLEQLQKIVFPTLSGSELLKADHYRRHIQVFAEGQFVITDADKVIGMTTTMRTNFDFQNVHHSFSEIMGGGWMTNHDPEGEWMYGLDLGIHPDYRGRKLARELYVARQETAKMLGLRGQLIVGMLNGYGAVIDRMTADDYYHELLEGKRTDPTITPQIKIGFQPLDLIAGYVNDTACGNYGVLMKWEL